MITEGMKETISYINHEEYIANSIPHSAILQSLQSVYLCCH